MIYPLLNKVLTLCAIRYAQYLAQVGCAVTHRDHKVNIEYDVTGIAKVSTIQRVELERDTEEVYYTNPLTQAVTRRIDSGFYDRHQIRMNLEGMVNMESFRAVVIDGDGNEIRLTREEYQATLPYRTDQARIVYPDGSVALTPKPMKYEVDLESKPPRIIRSGFPAAFAANMGVN